MRMLVVGLVLGFYIGVAGASIAAGVWLMPRGWWRISVADWRLRRRR